jgi:hypothetical protein
LTISRISISMDLWRSTSLYMVYLF